MVPTTVLLADPYVKQLQFHSHQKTETLDRVKMVVEKRLLKGASVVEKARYFMALDEQGRLDFMRAYPGICKEIEQGLISGEIRSTSM